MFNISLTSNLKGESLTKAIADLKSNLIKKGLDRPTLNSLSELKAALKQFINQDVRAKPKNQPGSKSEQAASNSDTPSFNVPKSDEDLLKFLTGIDLGKIRKTKDYTSSVEANTVVVDDYRVRLRFPISEGETFEENHQRAIKFFNSAMFAIPSKTGGLDYFVNPGIDMRQAVKVVCSRDTGDTPGARHKFDAYKNSNDMPRQGFSEIGRYAEWTLKQDAVKSIMSASAGFINISNVVREMKDGNFEAAQDQLRASRISSIYPQIEEKLQDLRDKKNLTPEVEAHLNIISLINNLKIEKTMTGRNTNYNLVSSFAETTDKNSLKFFDSVNAQINVWIFNKEQSWIDHFVKLAESILKKYQ